MSDGMAFHLYSTRARLSMSKKLKLSLNSSRKHQELAKCLVVTWYLEMNSSWSLNPKTMLGLGLALSSQVSMRLLPMQSTLDLSYKHKFPGAYTPDPYVRLMLEVLGGKQATFVRSDELLESWRIFTPVPDKIDQATKNGGNVDGIKVPVHKYKFGTTEDFMRY